MKKNWAVHAGPACTHDDAGAGWRGAGPLDAAPALPDTTSQLAAFTQEMADSAEHALDAELAADVLAGLGRATGLADIGTPLLTHKASPAPSPFKAEAPPAVLADASAPQPIAELANQRFGTAQGLALQVSQRFASSSAFATDVALAHAAGPLDIRFDLTGNKALSGGSPMALSYASSALVAVGPVLTLGMVAHGDLGTTNALAPGTDQIAGPVAKLRLLGQRASLNAETGYNFHVMPGNAPMPGQLTLGVASSILTRPRAAFMRGPCQTITAPPRTASSRSACGCIMPIGATRTRRC